MFGFDITLLKSDLLDLTDRVTHLAIGFDCFVRQGRDQTGNTSIVFLPFRSRTDHRAFEPADRRGLADAQRRGELIEHLGPGDDRLIESMTARLGLGTGGEQFFGKKCQLFLVAQRASIPTDNRELFARKVMMKPIEFS